MTINKFPSISIVGETGAVGKICLDILKENNYPKDKIKLFASKRSEGKKVKLPLKTSIDKTIRDILGGVRSSCTYVGAPSLKQLSKCTTFVRVNSQYNDTFGKI